MPLRGLPRGKAGGGARRAIRARPAREPGYRPRSAGAAAIAVAVCHLGNLRGRWLQETRVKLRSSPARRFAAVAAACLSIPMIASAAAALEPVVVTGTRTPQQAADALSDIRVIDAEAIERAGPVSLPELLRSLGGVEVAATGGAGQLAGVFVRGSNANHVLVLVDGVRINSATAGTTAFENIPLAQIERIEVLRGPASSLYGADAIGGVIQIFTKRGERREAQASIGRWRTHAVSAGYGGRVGSSTELSLQAGSTASRSFSATNAGATSNFDPDADPYRNASFGLALAHAFAPGQRVALRATLSEGRTHYDDFGNTDAVTNQRLASVALESRNTLGPDWQSLLRIARGSDHRHDDAAFPFFFDTDQDQITWQNDFGALGGRVAAGLEWRRERVASDTAFERTERRTRSLFASYAAAAGVHLAQASLRRDDDSQFDARWTGNLAYGVRVQPALRLSVSVGSAFKAPTFNDLYYPGFGNAALRPETSRSVEAAARFDDGTHRLSLTAFAISLRDLIQFDFASSAPLNVARARNRGVTLAAGLRRPGWSASAELTHQNPVDSATGDRLPRRARDHGSASFEFTPGGRWSAGVDLVASGERVDNAFAPPAPRLAGYALVHLRSTWTLAPEWTLALHLNNATDARYELVQGYNTPRRSLEVVLAYRAR